MHPSLDRPASLDAPPGAPAPGLAAPLRIGRHRVANRVFVAPMAGVTDRPFRQLCRRLGAGHAVGEMLASQPQLRQTKKSRQRADHRGETGPIAVQLLGVQPQAMAEAARWNIDHGAQIIDINMGCPAKKVCTVEAGAALMGVPDLAVRIVEAVVAACEPHGVAVTLKMRTGLDPARRNAVQLARAAESAGAALLTVHGRTRVQGYAGHAEYETIRQVCAAVAIPVVANGDIDAPQRALAVLRATGAAAVMVGRAAQGRPWLCGQIARFLADGTPPQPPRTVDVAQWLLEHLDDHHGFHGGIDGVRTARKHVGWAVHALPGGAAFRARLNRIDEPAAQRAELAAFLDALAQAHERWPEPPPRGDGPGDPAIDDGDPALAPRDVRAPCDRAAADRAARRVPTPSAIPS